MSKFRVWHQDKWRAAQRSSTAYIPPTGDDILRQNALAIRRANTNAAADLVAGTNVGHLPEFDHPVHPMTPEGTLSWRLPNGGGVIRGYTLNGQILPPADNSEWIIEDYIHNGVPAQPGSAAACFQLFTKFGNSDQPGASPRMIIRDGTIDPLPENWFKLVDGIAGHGFKVERTVIRHVIDGIGPVAPVNGVNANAHMIECLIEGLLYTRHDGIHTDGSHNDCIQCQGGGNVYALRCELRTTHGGYTVETPDGTEHPTYPLLLSGGDANGVGFLVQVNQTGVAVAPAGSIVFDQCRVSHGKVGGVIKNGNHATVTNLVAVSGSFTTAMSGATAISIDSRASSTVVGLCEGGVINNTGNNRWSNGTLLAAGASNGIYSGA